MKYIKQMLIIGGISFVGEMLSYFLPLPVPGSIYGLVLMLAALLSGIVKLEDVKETSGFLLSFMPIMFIGPLVGMIDSYDLYKDSIAAFLIIALVSTVVVMVVTGAVAQLVMKLGRSKGGAAK